MTTVAVRNTRYVRFSGKHCGAGVKCCDFISDEIETVCIHFSDEKGMIILECEESSEDGRSLRCKSCIDKFGGV